MSDDVTIDVYGNPRSTDDARLFVLNDDPFEPMPVWVPKSLIRDEDLDDDGAGTIDVPTWWAEREGIV